MPQEKEILRLLTKRYGDVDFNSILSVLTPQLIQINTLDKTPLKLDGQKHWRATFTLKVTDENYELMQRGRTGKFVPKSFIHGGTWREICKGRIISIDAKDGIAEGEIYTGKSSSKKALEDALKHLSENDYLEIDQYGASAKL